jgi:hypothetical protein
MSFSNGYKVVPETLISSPRAEEEDQQSNNEQE